jgi:hypothetical protein
MSANPLDMRIHITIGLTLAFCLGCLAEAPVEDGVVECSGKVAQALLTVDAEGAGQVEFQYEYLIGAKDSEGISQFDWTYRLIDEARTVFGESNQMMREAEAEKTLIYVQGEKPRVLPVVIPNGSLDGAFVLWVIVEYEGNRVTEFFVELELDVEFNDEAPLEKLLIFSQGA